MNKEVASPLRATARKPKLTDVAEAAGVSASTVDRVLNNRAGVRADTVRKVEHAMAQLGYAQNALVARLGTALQQIDILLPRTKNPFFAELRAEFIRQGAAIAALGARIHLTEIDVFETGAIVSYLQDYRRMEGSALVLVGHETPETRHAIDDLAARGVPVITLISDVVQSARHAFVGVDNFAAGRTAGAIMARFLGQKRGPVGVLVGHLGLRDHLDRRSGFEQAFISLRPDCEVYLIGQSRDDDEMAAFLTAQALSRHENLVGLYNAGAAYSGFFSAVRGVQRRGLSVVGHEHVPETRSAMLAGLCDALIVQDTSDAARMTIEAAAALATGARPTDKSGNLRIGILIKENLP